MQNCNCDRCDRIAEPCWNPCSSRISVLRRSRLCGKRVAIRAAECWSRRSSRGPEPWEAKSSSRTRTSYDRPGVYTGLFRGGVVLSLPRARLQTGQFIIDFVFIPVSPAFSTLASFRWHVIEPATASNRSRTSSRGSNENIPLLSLIISNYDSIQIEDERFNFRSEINKWHLGKIFQKV